MSQFLSRRKEKKGVKKVNDGTVRVGFLLERGWLGRSARGSASSGKRRKGF